MAEACRRRRGGRWPREAWTELMVWLAIRLGVSGVYLHKRAQKMYCWAGANCARLNKLRREADRAEEEAHEKRLKAIIEKCVAEAHAEGAKCIATPACPGVTVTKVSILAEELHLVDDSSSDLLQYFFKLPDGRMARYDVARDTFDATSLRHMRKDQQKEAA